MKKYVKKPIPIHAFKWDGNDKTITDNMTTGEMNKYIAGYRVPGNILILDSLEGPEDCKIGDYVIKGIHGEFYPCDPKIFKESYKEVK